MSTAARITIRPAVPADAPAVARVAALDSRRPPAGDLLVAEVGGTVVAALPVAGGQPVADPFRPTADVVALLELRAAQEREERGARGAGRRAGLSPRPRLAGRLLRA